MTARCLSCRAPFGGSVEACCTVIGRGTNCGSCCVADHPHEEVVCGGCDARSTEDADHTFAKGECFRWRPGLGPGETIMGLDRSAPNTYGHVIVTDHKAEPLHVFEECDGCPVHETTDGVCCEEHRSVGIVAVACVAAFMAGALGLACAWWAGWLK